MLIVFVFLSCGVDRQTIGSTNGWRKIEQSLIWSSKLHQGIVGGGLVLTEKLLEQDV